MVVRMQPPWVLNSGSCAVIGKCAQSQHHPSPYGADEACNLTAVAGGLIRVVSFLTQKEHDVLYVNNTAYHGLSGPEGVHVASMGEVMWTSDSSIQGGG